MKAEIKMTPHIVCPYCGDASQFQCDHILRGEWREFGPWFCDACGGAFSGKRTVDGIDIEKIAERKIDTADLLVLRPQDKPVYFIVKGARYEGARWQRDDDDKDHGKRFLYEEHSCPTNWLEPTTVYHEGDSDPHGLIEFVATRDWATFPKEESWGPSDHDLAMKDFIEEHATVKS